MRTILCILVALGVAGCGDPTDRPEDCTSNEFFDEARKLCVTCLAVPQPVCDEGCGFEIVPDPDTQCPSAQCLAGAECGRCAELEYFDAGTLLCEPCDGEQSCADDAAPQKNFVEGRCVLQCP